LRRSDELMEDEQFVLRSKRSPQDFTRDRILTFKTLTVFMLTKSSKSLQNSMNSFLPKLNLPQITAGKSAYSKARQKLKHTAFIELNQKAVVQTIYESNYKTWHGLRILGNDGSKIILPTTDVIAKEFGITTYNNGQGESKSTGTYCYALVSVLYDVLNRVSLDAILAPGKTNETDLAIQHLKHLKKGDLVTRDRGYASFRMIAQDSQTKADFLIRCPRGRFPVATSMLRGEGKDDQTVEIHASKDFTDNPKNQGLPTKLTVRFVRVKLDNGEYEVLATSLLNKKKFPTKDFKELYYLRWGIETFFGIIKTRLEIENFSGYSPEAIRQDFFATIYLTGAETILTMDAEEHLQRQTGGQPKKVNKAVSFNIIKERAFELFYSKAPFEQRLQELTELFLTNPTVTRKDRNPPRKNSSSHQKLNFWRYKRKSLV